MQILVTGGLGQDGYYLSRLLRSDGHHIHICYRGMGRHRQLEEYQSFAKLHVCDVSDFKSVFRLLSAVRPDRIYNLAAQSHVGISFDMPHSTWGINYWGLYNILESVRQLGLQTRIYQASTSEMFGNRKDQQKQSELTPFAPTSPYAISKAAAHQLAVMYREAYDMWVCCGILFNHESPRRPVEFLPRKVASAVVNIKRGFSRRLDLGASWPQRDWGWAPDYVKAMKKMMEHSSPDDYVIATGQTHSVKQLVTAAFAAAELGPSDVQRCVNWGVAECERPSEVGYLCGDASKAYKVLKWKPSVTFHQLVSNLVAAEFDRK